MKSWAAFDSQKMLKTDNGNSLISYHFWLFFSSECRHVSDLFGLARCSGMLISSPLCVETENRCFHAARVELRIQDSSFHIRPFSVIDGRFSQ